MPSTITVQFKGNFSRIPNVPVPVEVVNENLETVAETTVTLGLQTPVVVSTPGLYLVRAALPSGERLSASVTIPPPSAADPNPSAAATLSPIDPSPRESTAWAYTVQGVQRATGNLWLSAPLVSSKIAAIRTGTAGSGSFTVAVGKIYRNLGASNGVFRLRPDTQTTASPAWPTDDPRVVLYLEVGCSALEKTGPHRWWPYYQDLHVQGGPQPIRLLVAIPPLLQSQIALIRGDSDAASHPIRPLVRGGDPRTDALLAYLADGAFGDARRISGSISDGEIYDILEQKTRDPASAVVSVYYQLRAGTVTHLDWVKNLADWFSLIPDGALQYAWCILHQATPDRSSARTYFLTAARRGIPIYSYGVRLLYDGLNLLAEASPEDAEVAAAFRAVRRLAAATDWRAAVTSLNLTETTGAVDFES